MNKNTLAAAALLVALPFGLTACDPPSASNTAKHEINKNAEARAPYQPVNDVEFNNYNDAQKLFDDPNTIIWCSSSFPNDSSPIITVPIRGKLTSSSTSFFPSHTIGGSSSSYYTEEARSVDGMYHGNPPAYRFGFTPAGKYTSFEGMQVFCSDQLNEFQRQKSFISVESKAPSAIDVAQAKAQELLKAGKAEEASQVLKDAVAGEGLK